MVNVPGHELTDRFFNEIATEMERLSIEMTKLKDIIADLDKRLTKLEP